MGSATFAIAACLLALLLAAGCAGQANAGVNASLGNNTSVSGGSMPSGSAETYGNITFVPPSGFQKASEGTYFAINADKTCEFYVQGIPINENNPPDIDTLGSLLKTGMEAQGGKVSLMQKTHVGPHEALVVRVAMDGIDQTQHVILLRNNFALAAYGTPNACAGLEASVLASIESIGEK